MTDLTTLDDAGPAEEERPDGRFLSRFRWGKQGQLHVPTPGGADHGSTAAPSRAPAEELPAAATVDAPQLRVPPPPPPPPPPSLEDTHVHSQGRAEDEPTLPPPTPPAAPSGGTAAGWHQSPSDPMGTIRYWDGHRWTHHVSEVAPSIPTPPVTTAPPLLPQQPELASVKSRPEPEMPEPGPWKLTPARRFLVFASGAVPRLLLKSPTDIPGMLALGAIVTSVGLLSACSMTFALSMAFDTSLLAMAPAGLVWGAIIFNLDRWLLASARKMPNIAADFFSMLPRLLLAVLIGVVVSEPLVLRVFETAIEEQLAIDHSEQVEEARQRRNAVDAEVAATQAEIEKLRLATAPVPLELAEKRQQIDALRAEIDQSKAQWDEAERALTTEIEGLSATGMSGCGPTCRLKTQTRDLRRTEFERISARNEAEINGIKAVVAGLEGTQREAEAAFAADNGRKIEALEADNELLIRHATEAYERELTPRPAGILERMSALHEVEEEDSALKAAHLALAGMLVALDVLPVLGKFLNNRGPRRVYDMLVAAEEDHVAARIDRHAQARDAEAALSMNFLSDNHELRRQIEAENTEAYLRHVGAVHADIAQAVVQEWERNEKARAFADLMGRMMAEGERDPAFDWLKPADAPDARRNGHGAAPEPVGADLS